MDTILGLLAQKAPNLDEITRERVSTFRDLVVLENENQNLTRLLTPDDFYEGHVLDVLELLKVENLKFPALDLGSGAGVPGLLSALIQPQKWILSESEKSKAGFLKRTVDSLALSEFVTVFSGRGEEYLKNRNVNSVVIRAVASLTKIFSWIGNCSTWNNLILLKGPAWEKEWAEFCQNQPCIPLRIVEKREYCTGKEKKQRIILCLERVPRGTF